jgi:hypothetical protein
MWEAQNKEKNLRLLIEHDEYVGYYVYVFEYQSDKSIQDYLYDNLEQAYNSIQNRFGIGRDEFKEIK